MSLKIRNYSILLLIIYATIGCDNNETIVPKTGEPFGRAQTMKFYFSNGAGEDLLNLDSNKISPISYDFNWPIPEQATFQDSVNYFYFSGSIRYNTEIERYYWKTVIYGRKGYKKNQFYIYISETDIDTISAEFSYITEGIDGGNYYPNIEKLSYNGFIIREGEGTTSEFVPEHIYIMKMDGKSIITFGEI